MVLPINNFVGNSPAEDYVWDFLKKNLPNECVSLHNYYLENEQVDVMILIPNKGILIIEIKGYLTKYIASVPDSTIIRFKNKPPEYSSFNQAVRYRNHLLKILKENEGNIEPAFVAVASCYPYITKREFLEKSLNKISNERLTILKEDFESGEAFGNKIEDIFNLVFSSINTPNGYDGFEGEKLDKIGNIIAPNFRNEEEIHLDDELTITIKEKLCYSKLLIFPERVSGSILESLAEQWLQGTKLYVFFGNDSDMDEFKCILHEKLQSTNKNIGLYDYNIHVDCIIGLESAIEIVNGEKYEEYDSALKFIDDNSRFNYHQYKIEHAMSDDIIVTAGAGTGKTFSMISRINYLIWKCQYSAEELIEKVALITFTRDAAYEMRAKLAADFMKQYLLTSNIKYLDYVEAVENMKICTIHSMADKILRKYSTYLGLGRNFAITSGKQLKVNKVHECLNNFIESNPNVDFGLPLYQIEKRLVTFLDKLENKNVDIINDSMLNFGQEDEIEGRDIFFSLIPVIREAKKAHRESCIKENKVALSDLILLLSELVDVIPKDTKQLDYLFIDEFQDTDDVQIGLIAKYKKIFGFKLFVVGDTKQCIYRFRGAKDDAFDVLEKSTGSKMKKFSLKKNYRTDSILLQRMNHVFEVWDSYGDIDYRDDEVLKGTKHINNSEQYNKIQCESEIDMITHLTNKICDFLAESKSDRVAILVRTNYQAMQIKQLCEARGIGVSVSVGGELYKIDPTIDLLKLLKALKANKSVAELYNLYTTSYVMETVDKVFLNSLSENEKIEYFYENLPKSLATWNSYLKRMRLEPILKVVRDLIEDVKPWVIFANKMNCSKDEKEVYENYYLNNLDQLFEKISLSSNLNYLTINNIINYLEIMILTHQDEEARSTLSDNENVSRVICTTVHKAKGLQYEHVILPYCSYDVSGSKSRGDVDLIYVENTVGYSVRYDEDDANNYQNNYYIEYKAREQQDRRREEIRILYVAMTRAIKSFSYYCIGNGHTNGTTKNWKQMLEDT